MKTKTDLVIPFEWKDRHPILLEKFFYIPKGFDHQEDRLEWNDERIFGNSNPVCIELCSGNGQWIGEKAKQRPDLNWVAIDLDFGRARKIWLKIFREKISNLYVVCGDGSVFLRYYAPLKGAKESFVNFPDPWPKQRHAKHRLIQKPFLDLLSTVLVDGALASFATDDVSYRDQMIRELARSAQWQPVFYDPYYLSDFESYGDSYFANLWKQKKRTLYYIQYVNGSRRI